MDHECRKYISSLCWQFSCVCLSWVHCCVHCHTWETICPCDCFLAFPFSGMSRDRVRKTGRLFVLFYFDFLFLLILVFSRFSFLRNVERPSSGKNRSIYYSNCHWPTQAPSIIWPNKKPFNEMRENLGNHKSKTARTIYLGAMIYLHIYDMFHAIKPNFLKPFFSALFHLI